MGSDTIYNLDNVSFLYKGDIPAINDVSFDIQAGECWAIVGANGSGKSTLLKLLDGLYFATHGSVQAFSQELNERYFCDESANFSFRRRVGFVFQDADIQLFSASVLDDVAFAPLQLGLPMHEVEARITEALRSLQIEKLRDRPPHRLSGGEKKRVALASVLTLKPEVWLLDEPTAGLDPRSQSWLIEFIQEQHQAGKTIVIATHDLAVIQKLATHVLVFDEEHRIAATGEPSSILKNHELLHACNLIHEHQTSPINNS